MHFESCDLGVSNLFVIIGWPTILDTPPKPPSNQLANHPLVDVHDVRA